MSEPIDSQSEAAIAENALREFSEKVAPLKLPCVFWIGLPKTQDTFIGGSADMSTTNRAILARDLAAYMRRLPYE